MTIQVPLSEGIWRRIRLDGRSSLSPAGGVGAHRRRETSERATLQTPAGLTPARQHVPTVQSQRLEPNPVNVGGAYSQAPDRSSHVCWDTAVGSPAGAFEWRVAYDVFGEGQWIETRRQTAASQDAGPRPGRGSTGLGGRRR